MSICTEYDGYNGDNTFWVARLDDGREVYQDDHRPGCTETSAWLRLVAYCNQTGHYVTGLRVQFRDHVETLPDNAEGYFFSLGAVGILASNLVNIAMYLTGYKDGDVVRITKWKVPEIIPFVYEARPYEKCANLTICKRVEHF